MTFDFRASQLRTSKIIASGSTGTRAKLLLYPINVQGTPSDQGNINLSLFNTGSIGSDVFLFVSGAINGIGGSGNDIALFGGDVYVSGNIQTARNLTAGSLYAQGTVAFSDATAYVGTFSSSLSANRTWRVPDASGELLFTNRVLAGPNITVNSYSNGYVAVSASGGGGVSTVYQNIAAYNTSLLTTPTVVGQLAFEPSEVPTGSIYLRTVLSTTTGSNFVYVSLYNITSGSYVHIGGLGITSISSSATSGSKVQSVNLVSATNWSTSSAVYELQLYTSSSSYLGILGGAQFACS